MIQKLVADRYLDLPVFNQVAPAPNNNFPADFAVVPNRIYNIQESTKFGSLFNRHKVSQVQGGAHGNKAHRTFRWLPWVTGKVSCMRLNGPDILTGRMSGCWLTIFRYNGHRYAGHIGTFQGPNTPQSIQAKAAWRNAVNNGHITPLAAWNPVGNTLPPNNQLNLGQDAAEFYGAWTRLNQCYTVVLGAQATNPNRRRICRVVPIQNPPADVPAHVF